MSLFVFRMNVMHAAGPSVKLPGKLVVSDITAVSTLKDKGNLIPYLLGSHLNKKIESRNDHFLLFTKGTQARRKAQTN